MLVGRSSGLDHDSAGQFDALCVQEATVIGQHACHENADILGLAEAAQRRSGALPLILFGAAANADEGIWKAYVPAAGSMNGQFQNHDPMGLAAGAEIAADKLYCFSSGTSLEVFLEAPQSRLAQARAAWAKLHPAS